MTYHVKDNCVKTLILLCMVSLLSWIIIMNQVIFYVHPRFTILLQISDIILFIMLLAQCMHLQNSLNQNILRQEDSNIKSYHVEKEKYKLFFYYVTFIFSLAVALFIPSTSLDSKLIENKGLNNTISDKVKSGMSVPIDNFQDTKFIKISDKNYVDMIQNLYCHPADYVGKNVEITGFAYIDPTTQRVSIARYVISCCIVDASAVGLAIDSDDKNNIVAGHWYEIQGTIHTLVCKKDASPVLKVTWSNEIKKPLFTYIFVQTT
ncbi:TIGR03943 family putative permease subunit [Propionispira raffinosivorans]|uniref:TIGR03943 family putative permease subunit n=1 Tax=Propionispira raffinosivorans TaxID=86959 RepID=UPI00036CC45B|nr:TIGR03943 family protein [Propionispira raffinosivorans]